MRYLALFTTFYFSLMGLDWAVNKSFNLRKDQLQNVIIETESSQKILTFRWTLFKNEGLVFLYNYDDRVVQNILYQRHRLRSTKISFNDVQVKNRMQPFLLLKFESYDYETSKAKIKLLLHDREVKVKLKFIPKEAK